MVLGLHYQTGLHAAPESVAVEAEEDKGDLVPFVRLRLDRPVARMTWVER